MLISTDPSETGLYKQIEVHYDKLTTRCFSAQMIASFSVCMYSKHLIMYCPAQHSKAYHNLPFMLTHNSLPSIWHSLWYIISLMVSLLFDLIYSINFLCNINLSKMNCILQSLVKISLPLWNFSQFLMPSVL